LADLEASLPARTPSPVKAVTRGLIESSIKLRGLVVATAVGLMVVGVTQMQRAPVEILPEFKSTTCRGSGRDCWLGSSCPGIGQ